MSMLARYKKGGAIIELVKLIEDSSEPKRSQLLNMVRTEDAEFAAQVEARIFNFDKLRSLPENVLAEIIAGAAPKFVAMAMVGETPEFVTLCERCLGKNFGDYKAEKDSFAAEPPTTLQVEAAQRKLIGDARKLEAAGAIKLTTPETEAALAQSAQTKAATSTPSPGNTATSGPASTPLPGEGTALGTNACPPVETFNLQAPPPGLSGERFETFIKTNLGK